jgi:hypothetical protein
MKKVESIYSGYLCGSGGDRREIVMLKHNHQRNKHRKDESGEPDFRQLCV